MLLYPEGMPRLECAINAALGCSRFNYSNCAPSSVGVTDVLTRNADWAVAVAYM